MIRIQNYIDGKFVESSSKQILENSNPATGEIINYFPNPIENFVITLKSFGISIVNIHG